MSSETQKTMVRFDFPPGATAEQIAAALTALRDRIRREKAEARARADGTFAIPWRFQASGLTVPFRIRVPQERGWMIEPGVSKVVRVRVR